MFRDHRLLSAMRAVTIVGAIVLARPSWSSAQVTADLTGVMTDESGGPIAGATISIRQISTNLERRTSSNAAGRYQLAALDVGLYRIVVRTPGFRTEIV